MNTSTNTGKMNLQGLLWDASEEGENYICTEADIEEFILECFETENVRFDEIEIDDSVKDEVVDKFRRWLNEVV